MHVCRALARHWGGAERSRLIIERCCGLDRHHITRIPQHKASAEKLTLIHQWSRSTRRWERWPMGISIAGYSRWSGHARR